MDGVGLIVGIDRALSQARAVPNVTGNAVATGLVAEMYRRPGHERVHPVLSVIDRLEGAASAGDHHGAVLRLRRSSRSPG